MAIVKMRDATGRQWYFAWSSITDSPTSPAMSLAELRAYVRRRAADRAAEDLQRLLPRIEEIGTSDMRRQSAKDTIEPCNRAGEGETWLSAEQQLALAIMKRDDPDATMQGVPQDMICCGCARPIASVEERTIEYGESWCSSCWSKRRRGIACQRCGAETILADLRRRFGSSQAGHL